MAYAVVVAGGVLYRMTPGGLATELTLPAGVTLSLTRPPRWAVLGRTVLLTNNPSRSLVIDADFNVRPMQLAAPVSAPVLSAGPTGGLTGAYMVMYTNVIIDPETGALLAESDFSPVSAPITLAGQQLIASGISTSPDAAVTHHRLYRTLADGQVFYAWVDIDANQTTVADDLSDVLLPNLAAPRELGAAPGLLPGTYLTLLTVWKNRVWGVGDRQVDILRYSANGNLWGWPATYGLDIEPIGGDVIGITGMMPRKDMLGVAKRQSFHKISGGLPDEDGVPQWDVQQEKNGKGCYGPSIVVDDTAYYLGSDGVYTWGGKGFDCPSDGKVRRWFATDDYFNRALYPQAFVKYNERYDTIEWHLAAAGSTVVDRWVTLDRATGNWYGPHRTARAGTSSGFMLEDGGGHSVPVIGADDGVLYVENAAGFSDAGVAVSINLLSKYHDDNVPAVEKVFGGVTLVTKAQPAVGHCRVSYRVGTLEADVSQIVPADMRLGTETLPRAGVGQFLQLEITEDTDAAGCVLFGYEVPYYELGKRR
jgi:hypothetical protein